MNMSLMRKWMLSIVLLALGQIVQACDLAGTEDHPLLPRYEGACIARAKTVSFDEFRLPMGPVERNEEGNWRPRESILLEGAFTRLIYNTPEGRSSLEVMRNYQKGLTGAGFEELFSCTEGYCGHPGNAMIDEVFPRNQRENADLYLTNFSQQGRFAAFGKPDGSAHIALHVGFYRERSIVTAVVMESEAMEMRLIDAAEMNRSLAENGRITLRNIYFEFGSERLTAESDPALAEMARLLDENPEVEVYVVGHTDNIGSLEANLRLSNGRAAAVVAALEQRYGTASGRAVAAGVGSYAPIASNATEAGRAENRRVELVMR
ncbi:MAG: OmpA family protein [Wenzhouxiangella sp.]